MIHYRNAIPDPSKPGDGPDGELFAPTMAHDPLNGPARHLDPVKAMAEDVRDIVGGRGCVEQVDLTQRGWTLAEIAEFLPDALAQVQGRPARAEDRIERVPA